MEKREAVFPRRSPPYISRDAERLSCVVDGCCVLRRQAGFCRGELLAVKRQLTSLLLLAAGGRREIPKDHCVTLHRDISFIAKQTTAPTDDSICLS